MRFTGLAMLASASILVVGPACAQAPLVEKNVSMGMALAIIQGALDQCAKDSYKVSVTIVDKGGNVAASIRGDGTNPHTLEFSRLKAYTARTRGQTSLEFMKLTSDPAKARPAAKRTRSVLTQALPRSRPRSSKSRPQGPRHAALPRSLYRSLY
jgi:uncharacterized protein GlcG (DUF336 family)